MRRVRVLTSTLAVLALVVLAACGGGDDKESSSDTTAAPFTTTTVASRFTGEGSGPFCTLLQGNLTRVQQLGAAASANPAEAETLFKEAVAAVDEAAAVAPDEIKDDADTLADGYADLVEKLSAGEIDQTKFLGDLLTLLSSTDLLPYMREVCKIPV